MQHDEFNIVVQMGQGQTAPMAVLEFLRARKCLAAPDFVGNITKSDDVHVGRSDDAAPTLAQTNHRDFIADRITAVAILAIRLVVVLECIVGDRLLCVDDISGQTVIVLVGTPKRQPLSSIHVDVALVWLAVARAPRRWHIDGRCSADRQRQKVYRVTLVLAMPKQGRLARLRWALTCQADKTRPTQRAAA